MAMNLLGACNYHKAFYSLDVGAEGPLFTDLVSLIASGTAHDVSVIKWSKSLTQRLPEGYFGLFDSGMTLTNKKLFKMISVTAIELAQGSHPQRQCTCLRSCTYSE